MDTQAEAIGMFGPGSEAWQLDREAMLILGVGPRALLLQLADPAVAAGVDEHSDFREDPWRRLDGTLRELRADHLRLAVGGARRDPATERAAPGDPRDRLLRA